MDTVTPGVEQEAERDFGKMGKWDWVGLTDPKSSHPWCDWMEGPRGLSSGWASGELGQVWDFVGMFLYEWPLDGVFLNDQLSDLGEVTLPL